MKDLEGCDSPLPAPRGVGSGEWGVHRIVRPLDAANERQPDRVFDAELQHITRGNLDAGSVDFGATADTSGHELQIGGETHQTLAYLQRFRSETRNRPQPDGPTIDDGVYAHVEPVVVHDVDLYSVRSHGVLDEWYRGIARDGYSESGEDEAEERREHSLGFHDCILSLISHQGRPILARAAFLVCFSVSDGARVI